MKRRWITAALAVMAIASRAHAQADLYAQFSDARMTNLVSTQYLPGATVGVMLEAATMFHRALLSGDVQGRFVESSTLKLNGVVVGPRVSFPMKHGIAPYSEFMIGFAQLYTNTPGISFQGSTTDSEIQVNAGVAKRISPHWDASFDYSYAQYYGLGGMFNPKTFSVGTIFHFQKR